MESGASIFMFKIIFRSHFRLILRPLIMLLEELAKQHKSLLHWFHCMHGQEFVLREANALQSQWLKGVVKGGLNNKSKAP